MREGAKQHPQCQRNVYLTRYNNEIYASHAFGAIAIGFRLLVRYEQPPFKANYFTEEVIRRVLLSQCAGDMPCVRHPLSANAAPLQDVIRGLNDIHDWSREQIADWLESIGY
jgi:hypothetical protein